MQCFGDDYEGHFNEDEWEPDQDVQGMRELAEAEAASLGLLEDGHSEVSLPLAASSSSSAASDALVTPPGDTVRWAWSIR